MKAERAGCSVRPGRAPECSVESLHFKALLLSSGRRDRTEWALPGELRGSCTLRLHAQQQGPCQGADAKNSAGDVNLAVVLQKPVVFPTGVPEQGLAYFLCKKPVSRYLGHMVTIATTRLYHHDTKAACMDNI